MTFDEIVTSIEKKLSGSQHLDEFKYVYKISIFDDERAFNLGLYFNQLKQSDFQTYTRLKSDLEYLRDFYDAKDLLDFFTLKTSKIADTKLGVWVYPVFLFGVFIIVMGVIRQINGLYTVAVGMKKLPTYFTGPMWIIIGLSICWVTLAPIWRNYKCKKFYKKYNVDIKA